MPATLGEDSLPAAAHSCYESCFTQGGSLLALIHRVVFDVEVDADGRLRRRAGAAVRPEPARGEGVVHRRLAALADAPDQRIAEFASVHGLLRQRPSPILPPPGARSAAATLAAGQEAVDDSARVGAWIDAGCAGRAPEGTLDTLGAVVVYALLPDAFLDGFEALMDGSVQSPPLSAVDFYSASLRAADIAGPVASPFLDDLDLVRRIGPARLRRALGVNQWASRVIGGLDEVPELVAAVGGPDALFRTLAGALPEAYLVPALLDGPDGAATALLRSMSDETAADWREAAGHVAGITRSVGLVRRALGGPGASAAEKRVLAALHADLAGYRSPLPLSAAELAERVQPLLAASIAAELEELAAWPTRRGRPEGLYARALVAAYAELTGASPPVSCSTAGCAGSFPPTRNRRYCDSCRSERAAATVRGIRARTASRR
jgi:hypothetical protein